MGGHKTLCAAAPLAAALVLLWAAAPGCREKKARVELPPEEEPRAAQTLAYVPPGSDTAWAYGANIDYTPLSDRWEEEWRTASLHFLQTGPASIWTINFEDGLARPLKKKQSAPLAPLAHGLATSSLSNFLIVPGDPVYFYTLEGEFAAELTFEDFQEGAEAETRLAANAYWASPDGTRVLFQLIPARRSDEPSGFRPGRMEGGSLYVLHSIEWKVSEEKTDSKKGGTKEKPSSGPPLPRPGKGRLVSLPDGATSFSRRGVSWVDDATLAFALKENPGYGPERTGARGSSLYFYDVEEEEWTHAAAGASMALADPARGLVYRDYHRGKLHAVGAMDGSVQTIEIPELKPYETAVPIPSPSGSLLALEVLARREPDPEFSKPEAYFFLAMDASGAVAVRSPEFEADDIVVSYWTSDESRILINAVYREESGKTPVSFRCSVWDLASNEIFDLEEILNGGRLAASTRR